MTIFGYTIIKTKQYERLLEQREFYYGALLRRAVEDLQVCREKSNQAKRQKRDKIGRFTR